MTTAPAHPELCGICRNVKFDDLMPRGRLQLSNATGEDAADAVAVENSYVRQADGTVRLPREPLTIIWTRDLDDLGPLTEIVSRSETCVLCNFIAAMFSKLAKDNYGIHIRRPAFGFVEDPHFNVSPYNFGDRKKMWELVGVEFCCTMRSSTGVNRPRFTVSAFIASLPEVGIARQPTLLGRYRPELCNVSLFKYWLRLCTEGHASCTRSANTGTYPLRLIDVNDMCLVTITGRKKWYVRYLALSYVWGGGSKKFVLTKANKQNYSQRQGLPKLPKTISDAILLTKRMGENYLWVDSLCIISDDPQDKATQIPAMTSIYGCALLTIIAAAGRDANSGLPGLRNPRSKTRGVDLGFCHLMRSCHSSNKHVSDLTCNTTWATRAWTYQELLLSPRSLIFLAQEVIWSCRCTKWFEQFDVEHPDMQFHWFNETQQTLTSLTIRNYPTLVENYTQRQLTVESDIVDAFQGIMQAIPDKLYWGIPLSKFGEWLMWELWDVENSHIRKECEPRIPSWSWLAWKGCIDMHASISVLTIYRFEQGQLQQICRHSPISFAYFVENYRFDRSEWQVKLEHIPDGVVLNGNHLMFWALVWEIRDGDEVYDWVRAGTSSDHECAFKITWQNNVARRIGYRKWDRSTDKTLEESNAVRKLIIME